MIADYALRSNLMSDAQETALRHHDGQSHYFFEKGKLPSLIDRPISPYRYYLEAGSYRDLHPLLGYIATEQPALSLCITTRTAFQQPSSEMFALLLQKHFWLADAVQDAVRTCLQEAVINAVIHGNLGIEYDGTIIDDFQRYYESVIQALTNNALANKRISLHAWRTPHTLIISVTDQGRGFDAQIEPPTDKNTHGRGLKLIRHFAARIWQPAPNSLFMEFRIRAPL